MGQSMQPRRTGQPDFTGQRDLIGQADHEIQSGHKGQPEYEGQSGSRGQSGPKDRSDPRDQSGPRGQGEHAASTAAWQRVGVAVPVPHLNALDYKVPAGTPVTLGSVVSVTVGPRPLPGIVVRLGAEEGEGARPPLPLAKLKPIRDMLDVPALPEDLLRFAGFVARYYVAALGAVVRMILSSPQALEGGRTRASVTLRPDLLASVQAQMGDSDTPETLAASLLVRGKQRATSQRLQVVAASLKAGHSWQPSVAELAARAGVSEPVVRALIKSGIYSQEDVALDTHLDVPRADAARVVLNSEQAAASQHICAALGAFRPVLLEGVTGSGKTEVYFELIAAAFAAYEAAGVQGALGAAPKYSPAPEHSPAPQILVLLPEIALTSQWLDRFEARFGVPPLVWHSDMAAGERQRVWRAAADGEPMVLVGARSALFLPFQNLAAIIVDEEHDQSFKQEEGVLYHARDMAVVRAREAECPVVMASATPSMESRVNAKSGRYDFLQLSERHGTAILPSVHVVDMRTDPAPAARWISPPLEAAIHSRLEKGEQTLLFLNRRGYAPLTLCRTCGHRFGCPSCSTWLVEHRFKGELQCHQCGYTAPMARVCPTCSAEDSLAACGPGVERLFEEVSKLYPGARIAVMTSDTTTRRGQAAGIVEALSRGQLDIVIGTQMVTKGYHFPALTLVGVIDADLGLRGGDLRAGERTYQQLVQVAGRAGRGEQPGEVMLQTYEPSHPVVQALLSGDAESFLALEEDARRRHQMPPFGKLAAFVLSGPDEGKLSDFAVQMARAAPLLPEGEVLGPAPAPITRVRDRWRMRFLMHVGRSQAVQPLIRSWLSSLRVPSGVRIKVDVDPYSFL